MSNVLVSSEKTSKYSVTIELDQQEAELFLRFLMDEVIWSEVAADKRVERQSPYDLGPVGNILSQVHGQLENEVEDW